MNTLNNRLSSLEQALSIHDNDNDIVSIMKKREEQQKRENVERMDNTFKEYIKENFSDLGLDKFVDILIKSVKYCRENNLNISRTLAIKPSQELENEACIHFVKSLYGNTFSDDMLRGCIKSIVQMLYTVTVDTLDEHNITDVNINKKSRKFKIFK